MIPDSALQQLLGGQIARQGRARRGRGRQVGQIAGDGVEAGARARVAAGGAGARVGAGREGDHLAG